MLSVCWHSLLRDCHARKLSLKMTKLSTFAFALLAGGAAARIAAITGAQSAQVQYPKLIAKDPKKPTVEEYVDYMKLLMDEKLLTSFMGEPEASKKHKLV